MQALSKIDYRFFADLNGLAFRYPAFDGFFYFCAVYLAWVMAIVIAVYFLTRRNRHTLRAGFAALLSFILARWIITQGIYYFYQRNRPFYSHVVDAILVFSNKPSFPSGHATSMFAIATAFYLYDKKFGALLYVIALLTILGRVIVGVHYPSDVLAGAIIGIISGWLIVRILEKYAFTNESRFARMFKP